MNALTAFLCGLVFGAGLVISGMADPAKVLAFLDVTGRFDPSLLVVMGSALAVSAIAYAIARRRSVSYMGCAYNLPASREVDRRLVAGAVVFGIGWGIAGICPGPAFVVLGAGRIEGVVFVIALLAGMGAFELLERRRTQPPTLPAQT
ncbi:MAG: DUF6691 family protein [Casimicrobiaceae bacterium]